MDLTFKRPDMVDEAAKTGGKNLFLEILMFLGVFLVAQILMSFPILGVEVVLLLMNADVMAAAMAGDLQTVLELEMEILNSDSMLITQLLSTAVMILVGMLFCKLIQKRKMTTLGFKKSGMWKEYGVGLLVGFAMMAVIVLIGAVTGSLTLQFNNEAMTAGGIGLLILLFIGFLIQGMSEEVLCRSYFLVSLARNKGNMWMAIIVSSVAFGALHLGNAGIAPLAFVNLVLFGIFAGVYFVKRGNIWGIAAIHSMWNFAQGNIFGILVSGNDFGTTIFTSDINENMAIINGGDFGLEGGILTTIVLLAGTVFMMKTKQQDFVEVQEVQEPVMQEASV